MIKKEIKTNTGRLGDEGILRPALSPAKTSKKEEILRDYVESKVKLDQLTKEVDAKKKAVVEVLLKIENHESFVEDVKVSLRRYAKYEYSKKVAFKEEAIKADSEVLKMMKKEEEETGVAELVEETFSPVVK